ncbi:hypothetical protein L3V38_05635 [Pseudoalteromonas sp. L1]|nr:hypothetical protein [Lelliottia steviae]MCF7499382.1 hypothetical protein [Pseudoalteromonas sp. L1]
MFNVVCVSIGIASLKP